MRKHLFLLFSAICLATALVAQNVQIAYDTPENFFVCDTAEFSVAVTNNTAAPLAALVVSLGFPGGVEYVAGSVAGAADAGGGPSTPAFSLPDLAAGAMHTILFRVRASCVLTDAINAGQQFSNTIGASWAGGNTAVTTAPYPIETPLLVIVGTTNSVVFAQLGQQAMRSFTIRNTRLGALENFTFHDSHPFGGFSLSADVGSVLVNTATDFLINLSAQDFQQIGDGDGLFELNEEITVTEILTVTDCGLDLHQSISAIAASWSCDGELCQTATGQATLNLLPSTANPKLDFEGVVAVQEDLCGQFPTRQHIRITNTGDGPAIGAWFQLFPLEGDGGPDIPWAGIDTATLAWDSAGVWRRLYADSATARSLYDCPSAGPFYTDLIFRLHWLAPGASVVIGFDLFACSAECQSDMPGWQIDYWLPKTCPPGEVETGLGVGPAPYALDALNDPEWLICVKEALADDQQYTVQYSLSSLLLTDSAGVVRVSFRMPCGMSWGSLPFALNSQGPVADGIYPEGDTTVRWFEFATPIALPYAIGEFSFRWDCDAVCPGREQECLHYFQAPDAACADFCDADPDSLPTVWLRVTTEFRLDPQVAPGCGIKECLEYEFVYDCAGDSCFTPIEGWVEHTSGIRRTSLGLPDNDGDRLPDPGGVLDFSKIRRDRFMPGDTAETVLQGVVHTAQSGQAFENGLLRLTFDQHLVDIIIDTATHVPLCFPGDIEPLDAVLRLRDAETGQVYTCTLGAPAVRGCTEKTVLTLNVNTLQCNDTLNVIYGLDFTWDISPVTLAAAGCAIPPGQTFTEGDSIELTALNRFIRPMPQDVHVNIRAGTFVSVFNGFAPSDSTNYLAPPQDFSCSCPYTLIQYTPVHAYFNRSKFYLPPCEGSLGAMQQDFGVRLSFGDFFPYEYRPLIRPRELRDSVPGPVALTNTFLDTLEMQDGPNLLEDLSLASVQDGEIYQTGLAVLPLPDEGYTLHFNQSFTAPCNLNILKPLVAGMAYEWLPPLPFAGEAFQDTLNTIDPTIPDTFGFIPIRPALTAFSAQPNIISPNNSAVWDFTMTSVGDPVNAPNGWVFAQSPSGLLLDFQLFTLPDLTLVPQMNGIFQLGLVPPGTIRQYRLVARNNSCVLETLYLFYGWNCDPLAAPNDFACQRSNILLRVQAQQAELELAVATPAGAVALCDTTGFHTAEVFNALYGAAYAPRLDFRLPPGLSLAAGSCQLAFPTGSTWIDIPDPQPLPGDWLGWELAGLNIVLAQNGLSGFQFAPEHSASIRFRTVTACGFDTGEKILFRTWAEQNCGDTTNLLVKPGEPVLLDGIEPPYAANLGFSLDSLPPFLCGANLPLQLALSADASTGDQDSLFILLPPGAAFVAGSYQPGPNGPAAPPLVQSVDGQQLLRWRLPPGLAAGMPVSAHFFIENLGQNGCIPDTLRAWATQQQTAVCLADGSVCSFAGTTGETVFTVTVEHPQFAFTGFDVNFDGGIAGFRVSLANIGAYQYEAPYTLRFVRDNDGDGLESAGDTLLHQQTVDFPINAGEIVLLAGGLPVDLSDLCHLLVALDLGDACLCGPVALPVGEITRDLPPKMVCSGEAIDLGVPQINAHDYLWQPATGLNCDTCALPVFLLDNTALQPVTLQYVFTETAGDCSVASGLAVTVNPAPRLLVPDTAICAGQIVTLTTTPGVTFSWTGPGIQNPEAPIQALTPTETGLYKVEITDAAGCTGLDSSLVTVLPVPVADIGADTMGVCGNGILPFDAFFDPAYNYAWSPPGLVSDAAVHDPVFTGQQSAVLTLSVSLPNGCAAADTVFVGFSDNPEVLLSAVALTNCVGDSAFVTASGADFYDWQPADGVFCTIPGCGEAFVFPDHDTTFLIIGGNAFGCRDTVLLAVSVPGAVLNTSESRFRCAGESTVIFGQTVTAPGVYCHTFPAVNGCDSIHCVTLTVGDTSFAEIPRDLCPGASVTVGGIIYDAPGVFCQTLPNAVGCDSTTCVVVTAAAAPVLDTFVRIVIVPGETPALSLPGGFAGYAWSPAEYLSCADCPTPVFTPPTPAPDSATYSVTVTNAAGCTAIATYRIRILPPCDPVNVLVPNAFTPDGDGVNEAFRAVEREGLEVIVSLEIFNRWGQKVYAGSGADAAWDGRQGGKSAPGDTYIYVLEILCDGEKTRRVGEVTVLR